jgi:hypothetical protein
MASSRQVLAFHHLQPADFREQLVVDADHARLRYRSIFCCSVSGTGMLAQAVQNAESVRWFSL